MYLKHTGKSLEDAIGVVGLSCCFYESKYNGLHTASVSQAVAGLFVLSVDVGTCGVQRPNESDGRSDSLNGLKTISDHSVLNLSVMT